MNAHSPAIGGHGFPLNYVHPSGTLPIMRSDEGDLACAVAAVWKLIGRSNRSPWLFRRAGDLAVVVPDDEGRPFTVELSRDRLRYMLAQLGAWRRDRKGLLVAAPPPMSVVDAVLATPDLPLPILQGIVQAPIFGKNGTLLTTRGYHPEAQVLYLPTVGFKVPQIPKHPTPAEVVAARELICDELFGDFPFTATAERAHAVALLLLGFLRGMIDGPTPLHLIEKPTPVTGGSLMLDVITTILTGARASMMSEGRSDDEWRKRITAKLLELPSIFVIDNVTKPLDSSALASALTATFWEDRILGGSKIGRMPVRCLWIATANNPELSNEMARRHVRIRLNANFERPALRSGFRHADLMSWVLSKRALLVSACLTLCQAWLAAGQPRGEKKLGSFEVWAEVMGGALEVAGVHGFLANLGDTLQASDADDAAWTAFFHSWWCRYAGARMGASELFPLTYIGDDPLPIGGTTDHARRIAFGRALGRMRERIFDLGIVRVRVEKVGEVHNAGQWRLVRIDGNGPLRP